MGGLEYLLFILSLGSVAGILFFVIWLCHKIGDAYRMMVDTYYNIAKIRYNTQKQLELLEKKLRNKNNDTG